MVCTLALMLFGVPAANAHETIVRPVSGWADMGDVAILLIGSGHNTTSTELPEGFAYVKILSQSGQVINHTITEKTATSGFWNIYEFDIDDPGLYTIDLYHTEGAWTHFITNPPDKGYWENKYVDEIDFESLNTTGWADDWYVERSYPKHCFAKTYIAGPQANFSLASKPLGQVLEIVPLDNITTVGKGMFEFQVLFKGQPFENITVTAQRVGDDTRLESVTDKDGKVRFNLSGPSELSEWIIKVDTGKDTRVVELKDLPRGKNSQQKSYVGPVYRATLTLRNDYIMALE